MTYETWRTSFQSSEQAARAAFAAWQAARRAPEAARLIESLQARIAELEAENKRLRENFAVPRIEDASQDWARCDPAIAYHLIERHSGCWADAGKMMREWADANPSEEIKARIKELEAELVAAKATQQGMDAMDAAFEAVRKAFCKLQRYSFFLDSRNNVRRYADHCGNWVEFEAVHTLFEPQPAAPQAQDVQDAAQKGQP
jgi:chromosome segregation ATPase